MWETKIFKKASQAQNWIDRHGHKYQWREVFINNAYGIECRKLVKPRMPR